MVSGTYGDIRMFRLFDKIEKNEVYVIAEMSANHGGSLENALKIVREVAKTVSIS